jgi:hypothetical protein
MRSPTVIGMQSHRTSSSRRSHTSLRDTPRSAIGKAGNLHVFVSKMNDPRHEFLIGMHEAIEAYLAIHAGVSPEAVDRFDRAYEAKRKPGDTSEPGDDPRAPYHREHVFASKIERSLAKQLGASWRAYEREVSSK